MRLRFPAILLCLPVLWTGSLAAQEEPAEPENGERATGRFLASTQSSFNVERNARNPFHPIGYQPSTDEEAAPEVLPPPVLPEGALRVTSILLGDPSLAVINGREYARGETIPLAVGGQQLNVLVMEIGDGYIIASAPGQEPQRIPISR